MLDKLSFTFKIDMPKAEAKLEVSKGKAAAEKAIFNGLRSGVIYVQRDLKVALDKSIASQWTWYRGGSRDIIDTGRLKSSLNMTNTVSNTKATIKGNYNTPYAAFVHYGGVMKPYGNRNAADVVIPARPWVKGVLTGTYGQEKINVKALMNKAIAEAWKAQFG